LTRRTKEQRHALLCAGIVAAAVFNGNPFRDRNAPVVSPEDFIADPDRDREPTEEEKLEEFKAFFNSVKTEQDKIGKIIKKELAG
jgi:hypothetical protein